MRKNKIVSVCFIVAFAMVLILGIPMMTLGNFQKDAVVDCGSLYISGPPSNPTVTATAIDNSVDIGGVECLVTFRVSYIMEDLSGSADHAYVHMSISGGSWDAADAGEGSSTGILTCYKTCYPGETVYVFMHATYKDGWPVQNTIGYAEDISTNTMLTPENHAPNTPAKPSGPTNGEAGVTYTYTSYASDPDGDDVCYYWDWGDGSFTTWTSYHLSGETCSASHSWGEQGSYSIKVKAKDDEGLVSDWSPSLPVSMPANSPYNAAQISTSMVIIPEMTMVDLVTGEETTIPARTGYFVDLDLDGIYDIVHFDVTAEQYPVYLDAEGNYVIDIEPDGVQEATIDPEDINPASNPI